MIDQASRLRALVGDKREGSPSAADSAPQLTMVSAQAAPPPLPLAPEYRNMQLQGGQSIPSSLSPFAERVSDMDDAVFRPAFSGTRIIAVTSGKGGVGKTNLTVNLAVALREEGKRVIIIDADMGMANVDVVLGTSSKKTLLSLLEPGVTFEDILTHGPHGVDYISGGSGMEHIADFTDDQRRILWEKLAACDNQADIILIDTGAGLGKNVLDFILAADEVILVTTPEPTAITDAYAVMKAYSRFEKERKLKLVVNRVYDEADSNDVVAKLRQTAQRFLGSDLEYGGCIYEDRNVLKSVRRQTPFMVADSETIASRCVRAIAAKLLTGEGPEVKRGWREFLARFWNN